MLTFEQFLDKVDNTYNNHPFELRYGQTIMNVLYEVWPEKYKELTGENYDCFYDDGTARLTLDFLQKEWNNERQIRFRD